MPVSRADLPEIGVSPLDVVQQFWIALQTGDAAGAVRLLDGDVLWRNTGLPTLRGHRVGALLESLERNGVGVEVALRHIAVAGDVVLTDRIDTIRVGPLATTFPVQGTFRVRHGRIALWEDHFTWGSVGLASVAGATGALASVVRRVLPG